MEKKKLLELLKERGFKLIRTRGSHATYFKDGISVTVPINKKYIKRNIRGYSQTSRD